MTNELIQEYNAWRHRVVEREHEIDTIAYICPACSMELLAIRPDQGITYDTLSQCPYCEALFGKVTQHDSVQLTELGGNGKPVLSRNAEV